MASYWDDEKKDWVPVATLAAERDEARRRLAYAHDALTRITDADDDVFTTLESTVEYVVTAYRAIATAEAQAADEIERLRAELDAIGDLAYRGGDRDALVDLLHTIHARAKDAARKEP